MQVRTFPGLVLPRLPINASARVVAPVPALDERSEPAAALSTSVNRQRKTASNELAILARQNQGYSYTKINADGSKASQALQTYFDIQTQDEQERSQALLGIDVHA